MSKKEANIRTLLSNHFDSPSDLEELCLDIDLDIRGMRREVVAQFILDIVYEARRRGKLDALLSWMESHDITLLETSFAPSQPALPGVSVSLLTRVVPTAYCYNCNVNTFPLVTVSLDNTGQGCANASLRILTSIEDYSDAAVDFKDVPKGKKCDVSLLPVFKPDAVAALNDIRPATLHITVEQIAPTERVLFDRAEAIHLHARDTALLAVKTLDGSIVDLTEHLVAWVTPRRPEIEQLLRQACKHLSDPKQGFVGYLGASTLSVQEQARAIFVALKQDANLVYIDSPLNLGTQEGQIMQRIRLPTESLAANSAANCIDGTVLFASLLELASIEPLIVIVPGHAFVGWRKWQGTNQHEFLETTMIGSDDFDTAQNSAQTRYNQVLSKGYLSRGLFDPGGFARLIDVAVCRAKNIYPLE